MLKNKSSKDIPTVPNGDNMEKHDMIKSKTTHLSIFKQQGKKTKSTSSQVDVCQLWPMSGSLNN